jgi:uncharacterized damage-inducible protein DinB
VARLVSRVSDLLVDSFGRINEGTVMVVDGLTRDDLSHRVGPNANTIGWLVWHLMRVQDDHIADAAGTDQVWTSAGWQRRFGLAYAESATGFRQSSDDVAAFNVGAELLMGYAQAVTATTLAYVGGLSETDLDRIVDSSWDPPVTLGIRLVSVIGDDLKHLGQAEFIRGLL